MENNEKFSIVQTLLYFVFFLVVGCRDYLPVAFCTCEQNVTPILFLRISHPSNPISMACVPNTVVLARVTSLYQTSMI